MKPEFEPQSLSEAVWAYGQGDDNPFVMRWLDPRLPKRVIGEWEADAYAQMHIEDVKRNAEENGFTVGTTDGSKRALERVRQRFIESLRREFIILRVE